MLIELRVENLLLIERAELRLAPGLNVLTGETGAGKTVLAQALDLLLGGRARTGIVRPGAAEAYVEGVFELDAATRAALGDRLAQDADELVLARRVSAEGRSRALVNGRSASVGDLRELTAPLVAFYGQHEHRRLTIAAAQLDLLDGFCGDGQTRRRAACASAHARVGDLEGRLEALAEAGGARERELDLLAFELDEIDRVDPSEAEEAELGAERERLRHIEVLGAASLGAAEAAAPQTGDEGAVALLAAAAAALESVAGLDARLDPLVERWRALVLEAQDLAGELRGYGEALEGDPARLDTVEERLAAVDRLKRKHGGSCAAVLEHAARCRERRDELAGAEASLEDLQAALAAARAELAGAADALRAA
ncbi:MAG TPA: AAA family ATPase, partial [Solirubrobacteraceae bacterium]|nr:AAA family ATPase [Solirubrobacteraceae bacterium]